jgi:hypothetical protein
MDVESAAREPEILGVAVRGASVSEVARGLGVPAVGTFNERTQERDLGSLFVRNTGMTRNVPRFLYS